MIAVCRFRGWGILAPIIVLLVGCFVEYTVNKIFQKQGEPEYYSSHSWAIGVNLTLSGFLIAIFVWIVAPPHIAVYQELPVTTPAMAATTKDDRTSNYHLEWPTQETLYQFATTPSQTDQFCCTPMNWLGEGLMGLGIFLILLDGVRVLL